MASLYYYYYFFFFFFGGGGGGGGQTRDYSRRSYNVQYKNKDYYKRHVGVQRIAQNKWH